MPCAPDTKISQEQGVPDLQAVVKRISELMVMIDELEKQVSERKDQAKMLMQSVLREAFAR